MGEKSGSLRVVVPVDVATEGVLLEGKVGGASGTIVIREKRDSGGWRIR